MKKSCTETEYQELLSNVRQFGYEPEILSATGVHLIGVKGDTAAIETSAFSKLPGVENVMRIGVAYKQVSRQFQPKFRGIQVKGQTISEDNLTCMAGPCSIENRESIFEIARQIKAAGVPFLRGGAYKPRTSPYAFQGMGLEGLKIMREACDQYGLIMMTEATGQNHHHLGSGVFEKKSVLENVVEYTDILQVGTRNMKSYGFLLEVAKLTAERNIPVLLKRGEAATLKEFLLAAEYLVASGNPNVILCLRGIRTFEEKEFQRYTSDLASIAVLKRESNLPVFFDPSHAIGARDLVEAVALSAVACGADGLVIEAHTCPEKAMSDGDQTIRIDALATLVRKAEAIRKIVKG